MARRRFRYDAEANKMVEVSIDTPALGPTVYIMRDLPEYRSPVTGLPVDGRAARREDLARAGCREVDPSEIKTAIHGKME
jgi:hypothetical protein